MNVLLSGVATIQAVLSGYLSTRLKNLKRTYGKKFEVIFLWQPVDLPKAEDIALRVTKPYQYREGNRRELRRGNSNLLISLVNEGLRNEL